MNNENRKDIENEFMHFEIGWKECDMNTVKNEVLSSKRMQFRPNDYCMWMKDVLLKRQTVCSRCKDFV